MRCCSFKFTHTYTDLTLHLFGVLLKVQRGMAPILHVTAMGHVEAKTNSLCSCSIFFVRGFLLFCMCSGVILGIQGLKPQVACVCGFRYWSEQKTFKPTTFLPIRTACGEQETSKQVDLHSTISGPSTVWKMKNSAITFCTTARCLWEQHVFSLWLFMVLGQKENPNKNRRFWGSFFF